jgi:hypothetical protein
MRGHRWVADALAAMKAVASARRRTLCAELLWISWYERRSRRARWHRWSTERIDQRNARRFAMILDRHGWPGRRLAGEAGSHAAWVIAQHCDGDPALQKRCLILLRGAVSGGDAAPDAFAHLADRVSIATGMEQMYGTQLVYDRRGRLVPYPIAYPESVDARRAELGLPPLGVYVAAMAAELDERIAVVA